ncbi:MAG TPA: DUF1015 family protein [Longimicrobiales bacterium]|nr:DUF1015 family protein [Longimicrobiales bacterium]
MITLRPVAHALVPVDSAAAGAVSAPNYDEFQSDVEVWEHLQQRPRSVLGVTMAHCATPSVEEIGIGDSSESLERAGANFAALASTGLVRKASDILWVYEIDDRARSGVCQIGIGGYALTGEIRTPEVPDGSIIRNEGVREKKAKGRADLIAACGAFIGTVNNAVEDESGALVEALRAVADARPPDLEVADEAGTLHRVWIVEAAQDIERFRALLAAEPHAFVADGNHRSQAAVMLGSEVFLAVFFPAGQLAIQPYNRLVKDAGDLGEAFEAAVGERFEIDDPATGSAEPYQPTEPLEIGLYRPGRGWLRLRPRPGTYDPTNAVEVLAADVVQRNLFSAVLGIHEAGDPRLTFVGANRDAAWLQGQVDGGRAQLAVTLPAVSMDEFMEVCRQNRMMPPKSTWFVPKIRSGLVMGVFGEP